MLPTLTRITRLASAADSSLLTRAAQWIVYATVFLTPIFFLPTTSEPFEWNKTMLFSVLVGIGAVLAFLRSLLRRTPFFTRTPLDAFLAVLIVALGLSTIFSVHRTTSLVGVEGYHHETLPALISFLLFFWLVVHVVRTSAEVLRVLLVLLAGLALFLLVETLQLLGVFLFPWEITKTAAFNLLANSFTVLGLVAAIAATLALALIVLVKGRRLIIGLRVLFCLGFAVLILLDGTVGWYAFILGILGLLIAVNRFPTLPKRWVRMLVILGALGIAALLLPLDRVTGVNPSVDVVLGNATSARIVRETLAHRPLFGSGPETFSADFAAYRPESFNESVLWNLRFLKGANVLWQYLATFGIVGFAALALVFLRGLLLFVRALKTVGSNDHQWKLLALLTTVLGMLIFGSLVFPKTFVLTMLFWLFGALGVRVALGDQGKARLTLTERSLAPVGLMLSLAFLGTVAVFGGRFWAAEYWYHRATEGVRATEDLSVVQQWFERAVRLKPIDARYRFALAQHAMVRAQLLATQEEPNVTEVQQLLAQAESAARDGVRLAPHLPDSYEALADIYATTGAFVGLQNVAALQTQAVKDAIARDPKNPSLFLRLGRQYLTFVAALDQASTEGETEESKTQRQEQQQTFLGEAKNAFQRASELKGNFPDARLGLALAEEMGGNQTAAIESLQRLAQDFPQHADVRYELALMKLRSGDDEGAKQALQATVALAPDHANAHYQLSKIFERQGNLDAAIAELETVVSTNPDNEQLKAELEALRQKKAEVGE